jgi:hypothetical protein
MRFYSSVICLRERKSGGTQPPILPYFFFLLAFFFLDLVASVSWELPRFIQSSSSSTSSAALPSRSAPEEGDLWSASSTVFTVLMVACTIGVSGRLEADSKVKASVISDSVVCSSLQLHKRGSSPLIVPRRRTAPTVNKKK